MAKGKFNPGGEHPVRDQHYGQGTIISCNPAEMAANYPYDALYPANKRPIPLAGDEGE